jgi:hypothetical protein
MQAEDAGKSEGPAVMAADRGSKFAPPERGAHFLCRCDWTNTSRQTLTEAQFTMGASMLVQASSGSLSRANGSLRRRIVQAIEAGARCNANRLNQRCCNALVKLGRRVHWLSGVCHA